MRRFAGAALASGFAICALVPLTILAGAAGASAVRPARAAGAVSAATPTPSVSVSASPKPTRAARPTGQPVPPPTQQAAPPGPPKPVRGMPEPSANCLSQRGRTHLTSEPWAQRALGFSSVWDLTRGQRVTVAVVDSGIDYTPQLAGRVSRVDLTGGNGEDCIPHGTDVASIIAASDARARGIPFYGVAPAAHILSIRVQQQEGTSGQTNAQRRKTLLDIARGIRYAVAEHAKVINVSIQVSASYPALRAAVEFARNVCGLPEAMTTEVDEATPDPIIDFLPEQRNLQLMGGTMRLGAYDCDLEPGTLAARAYGSLHVSERHRHRYEFNNRYKPLFEEHGMIFSGHHHTSRATLVECIELVPTVHPWFVGTQAHPEFKSRPTRPSPLYRDFVGAALAGAAERTVRAVATSPIVSST